MTPTRCLLALSMPLALLACAHQPLPVVGTSPADRPAAETPAQPQTGSAPMRWSEVQALPLPPPGERYAYGSEASQFGELRLPAQAAAGQPVPVAIVLHGGCWLDAFDMTYITRLSAALTEAGIATWTPEYRRIGEPGGGWPGTFADAAAATDYLRRLAVVHPLDLERVVAVGHSAGGHLGLWLAMRDQIASTSPLAEADPLALRGVVGLAPIADLASYRVGPPNSCHSAVDALMGGAPDASDELAARYAAASPADNLPLGVAQVLIQGGADPIVAPESVRQYARQAQAAGDAVTVHVIAPAGHFEPAVPVAATWAVVRDAVTELLARP